MITATRYIRVDARLPEAESIKAAAELIKAGELVAFPTETVYGLGAAAFQTDAVEKIFRVKGRPPENALLVHVSNLEQVESLVPEIPAMARELIDRFWPGPLSIILPARSSVPAIVRGGSTGVGIRMPSHSVALALIEMTGPLAAPSANLYGRPSPTNASHVQQDLDGKIAAVLDGGETGAGLESTLLDLTGELPRILRRGGIKAETIEEFLGLKIAIEGTDSMSGFQTRVKVILSSNKTEFEARLDDFISQRVIFGVVCINDAFLHKIEDIKYIYNINLSGTGMNLYSILRDAEKNNIAALLFTPIEPEQAEAEPALMDRIRRASH